MTPEPVKSGELILRNSPPDKPREHSAFMRAVSLVVTLGPIMLVFGFLIGSLIGVWNLAEDQHDLDNFGRSSVEIAKQLRLHKVCLSMAQSPQRWPDLESPCDEDGEWLKEKVEDEEGNLASNAIWISQQQKLEEKRKASWLWYTPELIWRIL